MIHTLISYGRRDLAERVIPGSVQCKAKERPPYWDIEASADLYPVGEVGEDWDQAVAEMNTALRGQA
jgi:hypothetical protein